MSAVNVEDLRGSCRLRRRSVDQATTVMDARPARSTSPRPEWPAGPVGSWRARVSTRVVSATNCGNADAAAELGDRHD